jgi:enoyl-[acyl-carrier protein] reductase II
MKNKITSLFGIEYPIIQGGMIWCSGWELAAAVSNAGGLGLIGAGSMHPDQLRENIIRCRAATDKPFGVNIPLLYPEVDELLKIIILEEVKIVFTSAGNPKQYTSYLRRFGIKVVHVVASTRFAKKCVEAGVDAIVAEGFEAGGHNGSEETTTLALIPAVRELVDGRMPLIAAGGIGSGRAMAAMLALGADAVQIGSRFVASNESSAHDNFKRMILNTWDGGTRLVLKKLVPVRLLKNEFYKQVRELEEEGASAEELAELLGTGRAKKGMYEGDILNGELEIGQIASTIHEVLPAGQIIKNIVDEYREARRDIMLSDF